MKVDIHSNSINQVVTAEIINGDVMNIDQVQKLSKEKHGELIIELLNKINKQLDDLKLNPKEISAMDVSKIVENIKDAILPQNLDFKDKNAEKKVSNTIKTVKEYFGHTSDILLNLVKLAQLF